MSEAEHVMVCCNRGQNQRDRVHFLSLNICRFPVVDQSTPTLSLPLLSAAASTVVLQTDADASTSGALHQSSAAELPAADFDLDAYLGRSRGAY